MGYKKKSLPLLSRVTEEQKAHAGQFISTAPTDWVWEYHDYGFADVSPEEAAARIDGLEVERYACTGGSHWHWVPDSEMSWGIVVVVVGWMEEGISMGEIGQRIRKVDRKWELVG